LLSHADRSRIITDKRHPPLFPGNGGVLGAVLLDGFFRGTWKIRLDRETTILMIEPFEALSAHDRTALADEGGRLLAFAAANAQAHDIQFIPPS
jgi:hypothetical protein